MKRIFTALILGMALLALPMRAQDIDQSFVFVDKEGTVLENGATVVRNVVEPYDEGIEVIYSEISVKNVSAPATELIKMHYSIQQIDNGSYQICFPTSCNTQTEVGDYTTSSGSLMGDIQDIQSEWFPTADGTCIVKLQIELVTKSGFPPQESHKAWGPTLNLQFVKGGGLVGDVNGDGEVNIADVNSLINIILSGDNDPAGDVDQDGEIGIGDVNRVIAIILS